MRVCGDAENGPNVRGGERGMGGEGTEECEEGHQTHSLRLSHTKGHFPQILRVKGTKRMLMNIHVKDISVLTTSNLSC